jgi:hypothetical protein
LSEKWVRISFALIGTSVRIETVVSRTKQTMGVVSNRDILMSLPEHDLERFETISRCGLQGRLTASVAPDFEFRDGMRRVVWAQA